ncbi:MAG: NAD(+) synthase [Oscillospiraceae bacterium]|nr:NAD(+) synthase [Oscillospiraceae bacterium]
MEFCARKTKEALIVWIRAWFEKNGRDCNAVIGISGGKDSSVCAALCVEALGRDRVIGVLMPNGTQSDIADSRQLIEHLGIRSVTVNIAGAVDAIHTQLRAARIDATAQTEINLPPRVRMSVLYAVSQSMNGRVINTCNLSEDWVGYSTRYGDGAGDVSLLGKLTVQEVKALGREMGLPENLVEKTPSDGLCGSSDEQKLGFSYAVLDRYIREGDCEDPVIREKIDELHRANRFKLELMPVFESGLEEKALP